MNPQTVNIILINYGTPPDTIECLESIKKNRYQYFRVIIVDIQNLNDSLNKLNQWIANAGDKRFEVIEEDENMGFSYANNVGIKHALSNYNNEFFWIINNDTVIDKNALSTLVECFEQNKNSRKIGFVGSKIMDYYHRNIIENIGGTFNKWTGYSVLIANGKIDADEYRSKLLTIDYVVGASMFFHKLLLDTIGLMPEEYFLYYEDVDWSLTAKKAGFDNISCLKSVVFHKQGASTNTKLLTYGTSLDIKNIYI